ncbi:MAG: hypothetical protein ACM3X4_02440 [Ignavibacteriales bacterium]
MSGEAGDMRKVYDEEYIPYIVKWGRLTNLLGFFLTILPPIVLAVVFGLMPPVGAIIAGLISQASVSGVFWFVEPISYFPILGIPGTYMAFLSGNIANLRLPISAVAQEAAEVENGSEQGAIISTIGVAMSIIVNVIMLTIAVLLGAAVLKMLPPAVTKALGFILPALFGAIFAQFAVSQPKIAAVAIVIAGFMTYLLKNKYLAFLPGSPSYAVIIVSVFGTILIAKKMFEKGIVK